MNRLYHASSWQGSSGRWFVADVTAVGKMSSAWWMPARMLNISLTDYVKLIVKYHASNITFDGKTLLFSFDKQADAHKWELYLNSAAKKSGFRITD